MFCSIAGWEVRSPRNSKGPQGQGQSWHSGEPALGSLGHGDQITGTGKAVSALFDLHSPMRTEAAFVSTTNKQEILGSKTEIPGLCSQPQHGRAPGRPLRHRGPELKRVESSETSGPRQTPFKINLEVCGDFSNFLKEINSGGVFKTHVEEWVLWSTTLKNRQTNQ